MMFILCLFQNNYNKVKRNKFGFFNLCLCGVVMKIVVFQFKVYKVLLNVLVEDCLKLMSLLIVVLCVCFLWIGFYQKIYFCYYYWSDSVIFFSELIYFLFNCKNFGFFVSLY